MSPSQSHRSQSEEPRRSELHELGTGVLSWTSSERVSGRYGTIGLMIAQHSRGYISLKDGELEGKWGRLVAEVLDTRQSHHIGDLFRGISPSTPTVGERIVLGEGFLFTQPDGCVGLRPRDTKENDWLDPNQLYRAHHQTVRLCFEELRS